MSPILASISVLALVLALMAPLALMARGVLVVPLLTAYGLIGTAAISYNLGLFSTSALASTDMSGIRIAAAPPAECEEVLTLLESNQIILDRRVPSRLVVRRSLWTQLPQEAQAAVLACMESNRSADDIGGPVEVVEQ